MIRFLFKKFEGRFFVPQMIRLCGCHLRYEESLFAIFKITDLPGITTITGEPNHVFLRLLFHTNESIKKLRLRTMGCR